MLEGTLVKWHKKSGDKISLGDVIADVETDKATMEMEAFDEGTLGEILINEGGVVKVGEPIAMLDNGGKTPAAIAAPVATKPEASIAAPKTSLAPATPRPRPRPMADGSRLKASPLAKKIAVERGIDLSRIQGTGPGGRILSET